MNIVINTVLAIVFLITAYPSQASDKMSQSELKEHAMQLCTQSATENFGSEAIVSVRKRIEWRRDSSRLHWHDGLYANVRMVVWLDRDHLARVMCRVDQKHRISLTAVKVSPDDESGLLAISRLGLSNKP